MKFRYSKYYISIDVFRHEFTLGWWKGSAKLFEIHNSYYDGKWFGIRIGPFNYSYGPY